MRRSSSATRYLRGAASARPALSALASGLVLLLSACAGNGIRLASAPMHPFDVSGHWIVDPSRSEDPDAQAAAGGNGRGMGGGGHGHGGGMGGGGMGGGGMGGGGMGGGGMGGMGGGRHGGSAGGSGGDTNTAGGGNGAAMRHAMLLPNTLDIAIQPGNLAMVVDGHPRNIPLVTPDDAHSDTTRAGWDGDDLVVITHIDDKHDIVQRYAVAADHSRLVVTTDMKGRAKKISVVREFTPAKS